MSDFFSNGWSVFVAVTTIASVLACLVLLAIASRRKVMANDNTTGHVWDDDLVELNNPLPRWWMCHRERCDRAHRVEAARLDAAARRGLTWPASSPTTV